MKKPVWIVVGVVGLALAGLGVRGRSS